ncbi:MAG: D-alanyl-D-alanine carboxypeptidase [Ruminococcaceae bacterium]|nr:D-alanyl-D-alanine carboxypeptidase [Oscillospiraceae bacterium]
MKKIISALLALTLLFSAFSINIFATETNNSEIGFEYDFEHTSESLSLVNLDTGITIYSENSHVKRPIASLTKIMTYIVAYENIPNAEDTKIFITQQMIDNSYSYAKTSPLYLAGEELSLIDLFHMLMIPTGNDAAIALQTYIDELYPESDSGSYFVDLMNKKAKELGCNDTYFTDTTGLDDVNSYSTSADVAKMALYASTLPYFTEIVGKTYYTLPVNDICTYKRTVYTTNNMLTHADNDASFYTYATGMKAGSSDRAGFCVAASATYSGYSYVCVALGAPMYDEYGYIINNGAKKDAANMFRWGFTQVSLKIIANEGDLLGDVDVLYSWDVSNLQLVARETIYTLLPNNVSVSALRAVTDIPESVEAPIKKGDKIGKVSFYYEDQLIATAELTASKSVSRSEVIHTMETGKEIINSPWFKVIITVVIVLLILYFTLIWHANKKKEKMRRVKRRRNL